MTAGDLCTRDTVVLGKDGTIAEAAKLMREHHVGNVILVEERDGENIPVGIVTDRDLVLEVLAQELEPDSVTVGDIVTTELVTVGEGASLWDTMLQMRARGVRRIPVVNERGGLAGIVTLDDLLELLADELSELSKIVRQEQERERVVRR